VKDAAGIRTISPNWSRLRKRRETTVERIRHPTSCEEVEGNLAKKKRIKVRKS